MNFRSDRFRSAKATVLAVVVLTLPVSTALGQQGTDSEPDPSVRGTTMPPMIQTGEMEGEALPEDLLLPPPALQAGILARFPQLSARDSNWVLVDTDSFLTHLTVGEACAVHFDHTGVSLSMILPPDPLTPLAWQAIGWAPDWLAHDLRDIFSRLDPADQDLFAQLILDTSDPIVDEVAFVIAHTAPEVLGHSNFYPELLTENAEDVYAHDPFLDYVDIVDYGTAAGDGDYYSTVRYRTAAARDTVEVEMPRERYYWDIVHPKIQDEFPTYIDPETGGGPIRPWADSGGSSCSATRIRAIRYSVTSWRVVSPFGKGSWIPGTTAPSAF